MPPQVWLKKKDCKIRVATRMQMPKGDRRKPTIHRHSWSDDPTGISAKGLAPTGITSGLCDGRQCVRIPTLNILLFISNSIHFYDTFQCFFLR